MGKIIVEAKVSVDLVLDELIDSAFDDDLIDQLVAIKGKFDEVEIDVSIDEGDAIYEASTSALESQLKSREDTKILSTEKDMIDAIECVANRQFDEALALFSRSIDDFKIMSDIENIIRSARQ